MDQVETIFNQITPAEINHTAFSIKLILTIVFGVAFIVLLFFMAKRDSVKMESKGTLRIVLCAILAILGLSLIFFAVYSYRHRDVEKSFNPKYELFEWGEGMFSIIEVNGEQRRNLVFGEEFEEYEDRMSPYSNGRDQREWRRYLKETYLQKIYSARFGEDTISKLSTTELHYLYRNTVVQDIIDLRFKNDPRYKTISSLTNLQKYKIVLTPQWLSTSEIEQINKKVYAINFINNSICLVMSLGLFLIGWAVYCLRYRPSKINKKKRCLKIAGYCCLSVAYLFTTSFFNVAQEECFKDIAINVGVFVIMLVMFLSLMRLSRSSSEDTNIVI